MNKRKITLIIGTICLLITSFNLYNNKRNDNNIEVINNDSSSRQYVYPVGKVVGIRATTDGVLVLGYEKDDIKYIDGVNIGDTILEINNKRIDHDSDIENILKEVNDEKVELLLERDEKLITKTVKINNDNGKLRLGLWVRDKISGIGTITFYDPKEGKFKGIGHPITDSDTNELLKIKEGYIYYPTSIEIIKGNKDKVGQIKGDFSTDKPIGRFDNNYDFGISGDIKLDKNNIQLIEVGNKNEIKIGKALILFEDKYKNPTTYEIEIEKINYDEETSKQLLINIVDDKLLEYTGGIVQGMSGAPIIQNNKIIGAITHVFRNNPQKGYGIFIEEMIKLDKRY